MTAASAHERDRSRHLGRIAEVRAGDRASKVAYPIGIRELEVVRTQRLTPSLLRMTLGGPGLSGFESHAPDEHIRLIFPDPDTGELRVPERDGVRLRWPRPMPPSRQYTVRRLDPTAQELDIDIVLHRGGLASGWAERVAPGERVHVAGPPGGLIVPDRYDRYLLGGDLTALPAIARRLEELWPDAAGWAFVEIDDPADRMELAHPPGVELHWIEGALAEAVRAVPLPQGESLFVWLAGEATMLRPLRDWVRDELGLGPGDSSITGYWRRGVADFDEDEDHDDHD